MESQLLQYLDTGGNLGVLLLVWFAWKFYDKLKDLVSGLDTHIKLDDAEHKRTNERLRCLEERR